MFIACLFIFTNCERETFIENSEESQSLKVKRVSLKDLQQKGVLGEKIKGIASALDINKENTLKSGDIDSSDGTFTILTVEIVEVLTDSTEAYTFRIKTPTDINSTFENFVIEKINDDYRFWIYRYNYSIGASEEFPYLAKRQAVDDDQINLDDFHNYFKVWETDEASGCVYETSSSNPPYSRNDIITIFWCPPSESDNGGPSLTDDDNDPIDDHSGTNTGSGTGASPEDNGTEDNGDTFDDNPLGDGDGSNSPAAVLDCESGLERDENGDCVEVLEIVFDPTFADHDCQKEIAESIYNNKSELSNFVLSAFGGGNLNQDKINLKYAVGGIIGENIDGNTTVTGYNVTNETLDVLITLDLDKMSQSSDLYMATIIIHENFHAVLKYVAYTHHLNIANPENSGLKELANAYAIWKRDNQPADKNETEHFYMGELVDKMAEALKKYGDSKGYTGLDEYYKSLSWSGEVGYTDAFNERLTLIEKIASRNALDNERNKADTKGKGKKCE